MFSSKSCEFLRTAFSNRTPPMAAFMCIQNGKTGKRETKERGKTSQMKEENENISFKFYLQVLVLSITEMRIQLYNY